MRVEEPGRAGKVVEMKETAHKMKKEVRVHSPTQEEKVVL